MKPLTLKTHAEAEVCGIKQIEQARFLQSEHRFWSMLKT